LLAPAGVDAVIVQDLGLARLLARPPVRRLSVTRGTLDRE
jgi:collagenase-like PrtC family protease